MALKKPPVPKKQAKPKVHGRDHEHGGTDPTHIHYQDVGGAGTGVGLTVKTQYITTASTTVNPGGGAYTDLQWGNSSGDTLVNYTPLNPVPNASWAADGFYIVELSIFVASLADGKTVSGYINFTNAGAQYFQVVGQTGVSQVPAGRTAAGQASALDALHIAALNNDSGARAVTVDSLRIYQLA